ncbi:MAG: hypothetical protein QOI35_367 [Cryptosporangiaceae bacterium]|jgi:peptidoglycan/LPS O-acetylase OafA/YrhL|nr:hypothetical protein [Cryptosporangiaceae bacterium]
MERGGVYGGRHEGRPGRHVAARRSGRVPALDGIRALAVAAVLAFHGGMGPLARGGFLGVDAFFVLSGFLITGLLLADWATTGRIRFARFWLRRARRLLPALLLTVTAVVLAFRTVLPPQELGLLRKDALATLGYAANWWLLHRGDGGYFAQTASPSPLQHTWSLAIEEQFYLLWPLVVAWALWAGRRHVRPFAVLLGVCVAGAAASVVTMARLADPGRAYYGSDARAFSLLAGCALAVLAVRWPRDGIPGPARHLLVLPAAAAAGWLGWTWTHVSGSSHWLYHGGMALCALAVAVVIAVAVLAPRGPVARILSLPPLPQLGLISYGVYLYHWPVFLFADNERTGLTGPWLFVLRCAITLVLAVGSYLLVEQPIRAGRWVRPRLRPAFTAAAVAAAVAASVVLTRVPAVPPPPRGPALALQRGLTRSVPPVLTAHALLTRPGRAPGPPRIAFFGDSVGRSLGDYFPPVAGLVLGSAGLQGCGISPSGPVDDGGAIHGPYAKCPQWELYWAAGKRVHRPDVAVVLLGRWEVMDRELAGRWRPDTDPVVQSYLRGQLDRMIALLGAGGTRILLLTFPYSHRHERPDGGSYPEDQPARIDAWNRLLIQTAAAHSGAVSVAPLGALLSPSGRYQPTLDGIALRSDGLHFTPAAVRSLIAPWLAPQLRALAAGPAVQGGRAS